MKDGLWSIVSGSERPPDIAEGRQIREVCGKKGSCTGHYCFVGRTVATLSDWRTRRSNHCLEKVGWSVSKEDLGQQAGATAKAVFKKVRGGSMCLNHHEQVRNTLHTLLPL